MKKEEIEKNKKEHIKLAKSRIAELKSQNKEIKILTIGKKGREQLNREFESLFVGHVDLSEEKSITIETARKMSKIKNSVILILLFSTL